MSDIRFNDLVVSSEVVETIVKIAAEKVEGVASVGMPQDLGSVISMFSAHRTQTTPSVGLRVNDDQVQIAVRLTVFFGYPFIKLAEDVRTTVAAAVASQVGVEVSSVDVFIDALVFPKE